MITQIKIGDKTIKVDEMIAERVRQANEDMQRETGTGLSVTSSLRSTEEQATLYAKLKPTGARVAPPGQSFHETGKALDIANFKEAEPYLRRYGLKNDLSDDKGHFSYGETSNPKYTNLLEQIEKSRQKGKTDTEILDMLKNKVPEFSSPIDQSRTMYGTDKKITNDRDLLNFLSVKYSGKNPTTPSVAEKKLPIRKSNLEVAQEEVNKGVLSKASSLFSGTGKFLGGGLLNITNLIASKSKPVKEMNESGKTLTEIDTKAVQKAHELALKGDTQGAERLLKVVQSHGTNITLNDILPKTQQETGKEIIGAGAQTFLEQVSFTKGLGLSKITAPITSAVSKLPVVRQGINLLQKAKTVAPIKTGIITGAAQAMPYAAGFGASEGLQQEGATPSSVLGSALDYATNPIVLATGGLLGGIGGKLSPEAAKLKSKKIMTAVDDLEDKYIELAMGSKTLKTKLDKSKLKTEWKNQAGTTGTDPARTLAEEGIVPNQSGAKLDTFEQAQKLRQNTQKFNNLNKEVLLEMDKSAGKVKLSDIEQEAIRRANTPQNINSGIAKGMEKEIKQEIADLRDKYGEEISYSLLGDIKSARWGQVKFDSTRPLLSDANYAIAKTGQQIIQDTAEKMGNKEVAQLNRYIGDRLEATKFLESLNGKTVKGGRLQKYMFTIIGSTMGNSILGKILGAMGGDAVANLLISNSISNPLKRKILSQIQKQDPKAYKATIDWLVKNKLNPNQPLMLPAPSVTTPKAPIVLPLNKLERGQSGVQVIPAKKTFGRDKTGKFKRVYTSEGKEIK